MFAGDWHAGTEFAIASIDLAASHGVDQIFHVGDFGYWPRHVEGRAYLERVSSHAVDRDVLISFCDGNHEDHEELTHDSVDPVEVLPKLRWMPRGSTLEAEGRRVLFMGGAVSVDQFARFPGRTWFQEEIPSEAQWYRAMTADDVDVVVAHDTVPGMPVSGRPSLSIPWSIRRRASDHRKRLQALQKQHLPALWVHGHWHQRATATLNGTRFESLGHDRGPLEDAVLFVDLGQLGPG